MTPQHFAALWGQSYTNRGSLVEHYGTPAIVSTKHKHDPNQPAKHWWITQPVAEAIAVAEQLSAQPDRIFTPLWRPDADVARSHQMLEGFIGHINTTRTVTGLDEIPVGLVRPHMFRKTMAMLTDQFAGSEIALGIQLKHIATRALANRSTQGYAAADNAWAEHLDSAIEAARFRRLEDPIWRTEERSLLKLAGTPGLPPCRKAALQRELTQVKAILGKADKENDDHGR